MGEAATSRRAMIGGSALAAMALAMPARAAGGRKRATVQEAANLALVRAFIAAWSSGPFDVDAVMARYIAPDARIRIMDSLPAVVGPAATAAAFRPFVDSGMRMTVETLETFARGPLVMTSRIDTGTTPGKPAERWPVVGVFVIRDGKIHEWTDFVVG